MIRGNVLYPGCFALLPHTVLLAEQNLTRLKRFDLRALLSRSSQTRLARVCSVVRSEETGELECEVEPLIAYEELPIEFQVPERRQPTDDGAVQHFLLDFSWDKPVVPVNSILEIVTGISLLTTLLI
jgi:hypothetical protein